MPLWRYGACRHGALTLCAGVLYSTLVMAKVASNRKPAAPAIRRRVIPFDDEPITPAEMRAVEEGRKAFARGEYYTLEEAKAYVAGIS